MLIFRNYFWILLISVPFVEFICHSTHLITRQCGIYLLVETGKFRLPICSAIYLINRQSSEFSSRMLKSLNLTAPYKVIRPANKKIINQGIFN